jgi:signal transduction histidine kinase
VSSGEDSSLDAADLRHLLDAGRGLVTAHDLDTVLRRVLDAARDLTRARYAAVGVLDSGKRELDRFVFTGVDDELRRRIGSLPKGHGILGELIRHPEPLRLSRIAEHPRSYGFPAEHPPMETFLGVPVMIRGEVFGNLYLTEKAGGGSFDERDESHAVVLADWAAIAIDNARSHESTERRRVELERAVRSLEATVGLGRDLGGESDLEHVLELVVKRGRALAEARSCIVLLSEETGLLVAAAAGEADAGAVGRRLPLEAMPAGPTRGLAPELGGDAPFRFLGELGIVAGRAIALPLRSRGRSVGLLAVSDRLGGDPRFDAEDELGLESFATSAATVIATARAAESERLRVTIAAAERERRRWARELHDETLQDLGALRVLAQSALQADDEEASRRALGEAGDRVEEMVEGLQSLITELRPTALDELGIGAAIEALAARVRDRSGLDVRTTLVLGACDDGGQARFDPDVEATVYRIVQEALTNVVKHAGATRVHVGVEARDGALVVAIEDDGRGLDPERESRGFGLVGMRERVELADGELRLGSGSEGGTRIWASLPDGTA